MKQKRRGKRTQWTAMSSASWMLQAWALRCVASEGGADPGVRGGPWELSVPPSQICSWGGAPRKLSYIKERRWEGRCQGGPGQPRCPLHSLLLLFP